ncbi:hypothetical protein DMH01_10250 [Amycolatopsis sp. WAC 04182]|nr:hypothetical protein DMH01_10250 [Amycolatopsis sp. WAC 04182]
MRRGRLPRRLRDTSSPQSARWRGDLGRARSGARTSRRTGGKAARGGVGKTRLAIEAASKLRMGDGAWLVELAGLDKVECPTCPP